MDIENKGYFHVNLPARQECLKLFLFICLYFSACLIVFVFPKPVNDLPYFWLAGGIGLAALLSFPKKYWPFILFFFFLSGMAANLLMGVSPVVSFFWMLANIIETTACARLINWWVNKNISFSTVDEISALICASTLVNGGTALLGAGMETILNGSPFEYSWQIWWVSHAAGLLIATPFIAIWESLGIRSFSSSWKKKLEVFVFIIGWSVASWMAFKPPTSPKVFSLQPYMLMAIITWSAFRLGRRILSASLLAVYIISISIARIYNPVLLWGGETPLDRLLLIQLFLGFLGAMGLMLSASIYETREAEKSSREEHERIRAIGDNLPNGMVYQMTIDENKKVCFNYVSAGSEKLNGVSAEEVLNDANALYDLLQEEDRQLIMSKGAESVRNLEPFEVDVSVTRKDGQIRWMHLTSSPRMTDTGQLIWDGIQMDITDRKQDEERILELNANLEQRVRERTTQLIASNQELESFSYAVSHDLRSPLRAINGFSHILYEDYASQLDENARTYFKQIHNATKRMGLLIDDLLKLSRITRSDIQCKKLDLCIIARDVYDELRITNPERNVKMVMPKKMIVMADRVLMQIVLENLIENAWKFTLHNPKAEIELGTYEKEGQVVFYIRDNGVGFDMEYVDKLFGAFQRLHSEREFNGNGIGLAMVQRVIRRHGGSIWAEGAVNRGATFSFTLG